jgi:hypothetical protein
LSLADESQSVVGRNIAYLHVCSTLQVQQRSATPASAAAPGPLSPFAMAPASILPQDPPSQPATGSAAPSLSPFALAQVRSASQSCCCWLMRHCLPTALAALPGDAELYCAPRAQVCLAMSFVRGVLQLHGMSNSPPMSRLLSWLCVLQSTPEESPRTTPVAEGASGAI